MLRNQRLGLRAFIEDTPLIGGGRARNTHVQRLKSMTEQERQMLITLCARMSEEKDAVVLTELLSELNTLLDKVEGPQGTL